MSRLRKSSRTLYFDDSAVLRVATPEVAFNCAEPISRQRLPSPGVGDRECESQVGLATPRARRSRTPGLTFVWVRQLDRLGRFVGGTLSANGFDVRAKVESRRTGVTSRH